MTSKQLRYQQRLVAEGRCRTCGKKVKPDATGHRPIRCPKHAKLHADRQRERRAAKKQVTE